MVRQRFLPIVIALIAVAGMVQAKDVFYRIPFAELKLVEAKLADVDLADDDWSERTLGRPYAVLDAPGETYVAPATMTGDSRRPQPTDTRGRALYVRVADAGNVTGRLFIADSNRRNLREIRFQIPADTAQVAKDAFYRAKALHYSRLASAQLPGGAWFRRQENDARAAAGEKPLDESNARPRFAGGDDISNTYALFSGGRAVSENLQLDRQLIAATQATDATVDVDQIAGITVAEMDWQPLVKDLKPQTDPLASLIPIDQHAIFFPSLVEGISLLELAEKHAVPMLQSLEPQAESARLRDLYEMQFQRGLGDLIFLADRNFIGAVAVTGSDPYVRVGTDIAILFESKDPQGLRDRLTRPIIEARNHDPEVKLDGGEIDGVVYLSATRPDRSISSYCAQVGNAVVLTNSIEQLKRIIAVSKGAKSLASAPEYTFFRDRYKRGEGESALLILTDATIRRWCGPKWRIADSRRTRAAAVLSDLQAQHVEELAHPQTEAKTLEKSQSILDAGELRLTRAGVTSSIYNTLDFMTPIVEMEVTKATKQESDAYERWRDNYQRNWRWAFDPIALRVTRREQKIDADVTVMPLIGSSEYRQFIAVSRGASIKPGSGDPHDAIMHLAFALNADSEPVRQLGRFAASFAPGLAVEPLAWVGQTVSIYADPDPFWTQLKESEKDERFMASVWGKVPMALRAEVRDPLKLAVFLTGLRAMSDQAAPGMTVWQNLQHNGRTYVKITAAPGGEAAGDFGEMAIFYLAGPDGFVLTLNEDVLKRAIDRQAARRATTQPGAAPASPAATRPWIGSNLALHLHHDFIEAWTHAQRPSYSPMQQLAWQNIPILNEWKRLFPDQDPVALHEKLWGVRLTCPGGGKFVWNEQWQTMESTVYGSPGNPRPGPAWPQMLNRFKSGDFGVDFEERGIRGRASIELQPEARN